MRSVSTLILSVLFFMGASRALAAIDFRGATVVAPERLSSTEARALALFREEAAKRSGMEWPLVHQPPSRPKAAVYAATADRLPALVGEKVAGLATGRPLRAEGYRVVTTEIGGAPAVLVEGADARGLLFGLGRLLRLFAFAEGRADLDGKIDVVEAPAYPLRGIQLGFRAMSNTYGNWHRSDFEQQIRDLAVFGCNAIELVAGFDRESPELLAMTSDEAMVIEAEIAASYGLAVWVWTPAREKNYADPAAAARTLSKWEDLFRKLPRIDGIFVPGGDPGDTPPTLLLPLVERQAALLRKYHPRAGVWMSVQSFNRERLDYFFDYLATRRPGWLAGVIYAPWSDLSVARLRERVPPQYALRLCPDIGHVIHCQYPAENLDVAFAITEGREPICPRPEAFARIARAELPGTQGGIAYSDGVNDDVNKVMWLQSTWDPAADPETVLAEYGGYFVGGSLGQGLARGLLMLEKNWDGALIGNAQVERTFEHFARLEAGAGKQESRNWRFVSGLYRAYFDRYTQMRLRSEAALEKDALARLARAPELGANEAMRQAEMILDRSAGVRVGVKERARIFELGEMLHKTIGMKLSVPLHKAASTSRGANLDSIDWPLNNRIWLKAQFNEVRKMASESAKLQRLDRLARWSDPGVGGYYDNLGAPGSSMRCAGAFASKNWIRRSDFDTHRIEWMDHIATLGDTPLELVFDSLDPRTEYALTVVYGETKLVGAVRLTANGRYEIHPLQKPAGVATPLTFAIPIEATRGGRLVLSWEKASSEPSIRGMCHLSEIWLRPRR